LLDGEGGVQRQTEDGQDAECAADLLVFLVLDEAGVVGCLGEDLGEAGRQAVLVLVGEQQPAPGRRRCG